MNMHNILLFFIIAGLTPQISAMDQKARDNALSDFYETKKLAATAQQQRETAQAAKTSLTLNAKRGMTTQSLVVRKQQAAADLKQAIAQAADPKFFSPLGAQLLEKINSQKIGTDKGLGSDIITAIFNYVAPKKLHSQEIGHEGYTLLTQPFTIHSEGMPTGSVLVKAALSADGSTLATVTAIPETGSTPDHIILQYFDAHTGNPLKQPIPLMIACNRATEFTFNQDLSVMIWRYSNTRESSIGFFNSRTQVFKGFHEDLRAQLVINGSFVAALTGTVGQFDKLTIFDTNTGKSTKSVATADIDDHFIDMDLIELKSLSDDHSHCLLINAFSPARLFEWNLNSNIMRIVKQTTDLYTPENFDEFNIIFNKTFTVSPPGKASQKYFAMSTDAFKKQIAFGLIPESTPGNMQNDILVTAKNDTFNHELVAYSNDNHHIALGCFNKTIKIFDTWQLKVVQEFTAFAERGAVDITSIKLSPDGFTVFVAADNTIMQYNALTGQHMQTMQTAAPITELQLSANGLVLAATLKNNSIAMLTFNTQAQGMIRTMTPKQQRLLAVIAARANGTMHCDSSGAPAAPQPSSISEGQFPFEVECALLRNKNITLRTESAVTEEQPKKELSAVEKSNQMALAYQRQAQQGAKKRPQRPDTDDADGIEESASKKARIAGAGTGAGSGSSSAQAMDTSEDNA